jgi:5-methyltetrahydropteroyltriglutamate--homocysteine methyltransferase
MFPAFLDMAVDEIHVEMANREFSEVEVIGEIARRRDVAVGIVDVKSYYVETADDVAERVRLCLRHAPPSGCRSRPTAG